MEKEIFEGPKTVEDVLRGRLNPKTGEVKLGGLESIAEELKKIRRIIIIGCGTAYYAGLVGKIFFEDIAGIPTVADIASEFKYRKPIFDDATLLIAVSQLGETTDTLEVVKEAKRHGVCTVGVVNVVGSSIARETDAGVYTRAGQEVGVASTKAFLSQISALALIALYLGRDRRLSRAESLSYGKALFDIPKKIKKILSQSDAIKRQAKVFSKHSHAFFVGRKWSYPIALEGALKLKEISYIHAEGYGAGEMKHGPLALIDPDFPTVVVVPDDEVRTKTLSNIQEIKARKGKIFAVATEGDKQIKNIADDFFYIPKTLECFSPLLSVVPLHLLAYHASCALGLDPDKPRNLAKSVTVE